jgi:hypothetical protein
MGKAKALLEIVSILEGEDKRSLPYLWKVYVDNEITRSDPSKYLDDAIESFTQGASKFGYSRDQVKDFVATMKDEEMDTSLKGKAKRFLSKINQPWKRTPDSKYDEQPHRDRSSHDDTLMDRFTKGVSRALSPR